MIEMGNKIYQLRKDIDSKLPFVNLKTNGSLTSKKGIIPLRSPQ